ncbi:MAG: hypothetical protein QM490_04840 [Candidatus Gracilibacteria bacterium]
MVETTKKTQTTKKKPVRKTAVKAATKATTKTSAKTVKNVAVKIPAKTAVKSVRKAAVKATAKTSAKPVKKAVKKAPAKTTKKSVIKTAVKVPVKIKLSKASINRKKIVNNGSFAQNFNFIKFNFLDVSLLFKNFIHWNISKIIIFVWSGILGLIAIIPFVLSLFAYTSIVNIDILTLLNGNIGGDLMYYLIGYFLLFITVAVFFISFSYSNILLMNVNNAYLKGKKLGYKANDYFKIKKIIQFFNLSLLNISILLIPVLLFFVLIGVLFLVSGSLEEISRITSEGMFNHISILGLLFFVISTIAGVYLSYRIMFSYFIFSDSKKYDEKKNVLTYIKESCNKTKNVKNFFKLITIFIIFAFLLSPINYLGKVLEKNDRDLKNYSMFLSLSEEQKTSLIGNDLYYIESLKLNYEGLTLDDVNIKLNLNDRYVILFTIFDFVLLYGLFIMITSSFYRRELV